MNNSFQEQVEALVGPFLRDRGYTVQRTQSVANGLITNVVYQRQDRQLGFYENIPDGEVNCMIGDAKASIDDLSPPHWTYLNQILIETKQVSRDVFLAEATGPHIDRDMRLHLTSQRVMMYFESLDQYTLRK